MSTLNWKELENAPTRELPYPHMIIDQAIPQELHQDLNNDFPKFSFPGLVPPASLSYGKSFDRLLKELDSPQLRQIIGHKLGVDLSDKPTLVTVRGSARQRDGRIHVDTPDKLATILLYLNKEWVHAGGKIRVLNNGTDIEDYVTEVPPLMGKMFIFKVTDNCWHGHAPLSNGGTRRAIMVNYMASPQAHNKHHKKHMRSAQFKKLKQLFLRRN